jgi:hypothetical protein
VHSQLPPFFKRNANNSVVRIASIHKYTLVKSGLTPNVFDPCSKRTALAQAFNTRVCTWILIHEALDEGFFPGFRK